MLTKEQYLLSCLAEECAEVTQRVTKALRFGTTEIQPGQIYDNSAKITFELDDLIAVAVYLQEIGTLKGTLIPSDLILEQKKEKLDRFMQYAQTIGELECTPTTNT